MLGVIEGVALVDGVTETLGLGVEDGVAVTLTLGVIEGVTLVLGVTLGVVVAVAVTVGVTLTLGVMLGVTLTLGVLVGVTVGVGEGLAFIKYLISSLAPQVSLLTSLMLVADTGISTVMPSTSVSTSTLEAIKFVES